MNSIEIVSVREEQKSLNQLPGTLPIGEPTPLIRLNRLSDFTNCEILAKAEFLNPGGSIKYRTALGIIDAAEQSGALRPGDTIVEGSAGNTGIGLAIVAQERGYRTVIVLCDTTSPEKIQLLGNLGAEVVTVPERPPGDPENYVNVAQRLAVENGWYWSNQFDNPANRLAHYHISGPEIWEQTGGKVTAFVSAIGTGGTLAGTSTFLKEQNPNLTVVCADPPNGAMWSWFTRGRAETDGQESIAEGIGQTRVTGNLAGITVNRAYRISDQTAVTMVYHLLREEGLKVGLSSGVNVAGALRLALERGPGQTIVTTLCDSGANYASRLFDERWLASHHLNSSLPLESLLRQ